MAEWPGVELRLQKSGGKTYLLGYVTDPRETGQTPVNSAYGIWDVSAFTNLQDGKWHTIAWIWACQPDGYDVVLDSFNVTGFQKCVLVVDGYVIKNQNTTWGGKHDELSFVHNAHNDSTFLGVGAYMNSQASASSWANRFNVTKPASMKIGRLAMWDRTLGKNVFDEFLGRDPGFGDFYQPQGLDTNSGQPDQDSFLWASRTFGTPATKSYWDPITGSKFKVLSANVVAYYKFDEGLTEDSIVADDWASVSSYSDTSSTGVGHGKQSNPGTGNPISFISSVYDPGSYLIQDSLYSQEDIFKSGRLVFTDEFAISRQVGWINYDLGMMVFDGEYAPNGSAATGLPFLQSIGVSGMTMVKGLSASNFYVNKINFTSQEYIERMMINIGVSGEEMNFTENPTGIDQTTGNQILDPPGGYVTSVGLYNYQNELMAIAKFNKPIRKDADHNVISQIKLDF